MVPKCTGGSRRDARGVVAVVAALLLAACSRDEGPATPSSSTNGRADASGEGVTVPDGGAEPPSIQFKSAQEYVAAERLASASEPKACSRLDASAGRLRVALGQVGPVGGLADAVKRATATFGPFDPLLFGEVERGSVAATADGKVSLEELDLLEIELDHHLASGGVLSADRRALLGSLSGTRVGAAQSPMVRARSLDALVRLAELLADVQACSPRK